MIKQPDRLNLTQNRVIKKGKRNMFKLYKKADILQKISDKVKTVEDLFNLPLSEFDRECCDYWFNEYSSVSPSKQS